MKKYVCQKVGDIFFHILMHFNAHSAIFIYYIKTKSFNTNKIMTASQVQRKEGSYNGKTCLNKEKV